MVRGKSEDVAVQSEMLVRLLADEVGQDLIEYGLILALVALGAIATMNGLATSLGTVFGALGTTVTSSV